MRFLRQNTAVLVTVGPFYDKTDGVTIETALTITNERITLTADTDGGSAPTNILDNIAGATSGTSNDLNYITGNDAGLMQLELSAADTNRVGRMFLTITDAANHVPVFHEFFVLPQAIYDWLTGVVTPLPANVTQFGGTNLTATGGRPEVNTTHAAGTAWGSGAITAASIAAAALNGKGDWNIGKTGYALSAAGVQAIWDALTSALTAVGSIGKKLADWTIGTAQTGDAFARLGAPAGASVSADIASIQADTTSINNSVGDLTTDLAAVRAKTDNLPSDPADASVVAGLIDTVDNFVDTEVAAIKAVTDKLDTALELDGAVYRYTTNALEQAPGGSAPTVQQIVDGVWDEAIASHLDSGSTGAALNGAGAAGDPWGTTLPGAYGAGTAGKILGDNLNATVSSRASQMSVDDVPTNAELATALAAADDAVLSAVAGVQSDTNDIQTRLPAALVSGRMDSNVQAMANGVITAAVIATDAIDNDAIAANAVAEIQNGLATQASVDDIPTNAELATALAGADDAILAQVALVKAKTDALPSDPADQSAVEAAITAATSPLASQASVNTVAGYIDTEVAAGLAAVDTEVAAIKAKTDQLNFGVTGKVDANVTHVNETAVTGTGAPGDEWGAA
jgi:hypothetical protein